MSYPYGDAYTSYGRLTISTSNVGNSIVSRDNYGRCSVSTPTSGTEAANKSYVDTAISNLPKYMVYKGVVSYPGDLPRDPQYVQVGDCYTVTYGNRAGTIIDGSLWTYTGTSTDWVSVGPSNYVEKKTTSVANYYIYAYNKNGEASLLTMQTNGTTAPTGAAIPLTISGQVPAADPTQPYYAATKNYVDTAIATAIGNAIGGSY